MPKAKQVAIRAAGRPREHDRQAIAEEMIEWAQLPTSINLCGFCSTREPPIDPTKITLWAAQCKEFRESYNIAKAFLGERREKLLSANKLHTKAYDLNAKNYDHFLKDDSRQEAEFESNLKKEEAKVIPKEDVDRLDAFLDHLKDLKKSKNKDKNLSKS